MTNLTRESLAAAIKQVWQTVPYEFGAHMAEDFAELILAALPSPAPEPPPLIQDSIRRIVQVIDNDEGGAELYEAAVAMRRLVLDSPEWWRAAQPAPDLDLSALYMTMHNLTRSGVKFRWYDERAEEWVETDSPAFADAIADNYMRFLQARESGGEP